MILVDYIIGPRAEFLNAYSAVQRLLGQQPTFKNSMVAQKIGAAGELGIVIIVNVIIGWSMTVVTRFIRKK
jgi:hypothetical protein